MKRAAAILLCFGVLADAASKEMQTVSAVDARGRRYVSRILDTTPDPWKTDGLYAPKPDYPYSERSLHHEGLVIIRLDIDTKTGTTTYVTMLQSSGFPKLDEAAVRCMARWRWKPGTWKQVEVPVIFTMSGTYWHPELPKNLRK
jgi:TonB family protein